jgi:hypothetical protein
VLVTAALFGFIIRDVKMGRQLKGPVSLWEMTGIGMTDDYLEQCFDLMVRN